MVCRDSWSCNSSITMYGNIVVVSIASSESCYGIVSVLGRASLALLCSQIELYLLQYIHGGSCGLVYRDNHYAWLLSTGLIGTYLVNLGLISLLWMRPSCSEPYLVKCCSLHPNHVIGFLVPKPAWQGFVLCVWMREITGQVQRC